MSDRTEYDQYIGLIGPSDDLRARLLLDMMRKKADQKKGAVAQYNGNDMVLDGKESQLQNQWFEGAAQNTGINDAWKNYIKNLKATGAAGVDIGAGNVTKGENLLKNPLIKEGSIEDFIRQFLIQINWNVKPGSKDTVTFDISEVAPNGSGKAFGDLAAVTADATSRSFKYKFDKFLLNRLLEQAMVQAQIQTNSSPELELDADGINENRYIIKDNVLIDTRTGKPVTSDSDAAKALTQTDKCFGTNVDFTNLTGKPAAGKTCSDYLQDCLSGKNIDKCKIYLNTDTFWSDSRKEVEDMLPFMAVKTLEAFEFKRVNKNGVQQFQSVDQWLAQIQKKETSPGKPMLSDTEFKAIQGNDKLRGYFNMLVDKINKNPQILNPGMAAVAPSADQFGDSYLSRLGVKARAPRRSVVGEVARLGQLVSDHQARLRVSIGGPFGFGSTFWLTGGADSVKESTWSLIQAQYNGLVAQLKNAGKSVSDADDKKIKQLIDELRQREIKLNQVVNVINNYNQLLRVHGQTDADSQLSYSHIKQFVDKRDHLLQRVTKRQSDLVSIIQSLAKAVNKETDKTDEQVVNDPINYKRL